LPSLIRCMRPAGGSLSATAAAGRVGFGRRGSRTPIVGGRLRHLGRWLRTQCTAAARPCPFACRRSCVISRLCTCCRWVMSHTTHVSDVSSNLWRVHRPRRTGQITSRSGCSVSPVSPGFRRVRFTNRFTEQPLDLRFLRSLRGLLVGVVPRPRASRGEEDGEYHE